MKMERVDQIAKAVLYEGYMLYPYRPSSVKNRQRFNFGVFYPPDYSGAQAGAEPSTMHTECLVCGAEAAVEIRLRFLHLCTRSPRQPDSLLPEDWQEAAEREVVVSSLSIEELCRQTVISKFVFPAHSEATAGTGHEGDQASVVYGQRAVDGTIEISGEKIRKDEDVFRIRISVRNTTSIESPSCCRDEALMHSLVSTHIVLCVKGGEFVSLLEPPEYLQESAALCENIGVWPVLVGDPGQRDTMLASPIILYDYPQIAPESAGDLFDGTEIDEILSLRIMTLTDEEKQEIRRSGGRARQILERTENMPAEQFMKLHGAVRGLRPVNLDPPQEDAP